MRKRRKLEKLIKQELKEKKLIEFSADEFFGERELEMSKRDLNSSLRDDLFVTIYLMDY